MCLKENSPILTSAGWLNLGNTDVATLAAKSCDALPGIRNVKHIQPQDTVRGEREQGVGASFLHRDGGGVQKGCRGCFSGCKARSRRACKEEEEEEKGWALGL